MGSGKHLIKNYSILYVSFFLIIVVLVMGQACGQVGDNSSLRGTANTTSNEALLIENGILDSIGEKQNGQNNGDYYGGMSEVTSRLVVNRLQKMNSFIAELSSSNNNLIPPVLDAVIERVISPKCRTALSAPCINGMREASFQSCKSLLGAFEYNGGHLLTYNNNQCSSDQVGNITDHTFNIVFTNQMNNNKLTYSSAVHLNYRGESVGGGSTYSRVKGGFEFNIKGRRIKRDAPQFKIDNSSRTPSPLKVTVLPDNQRSLTGSIVINDNLNKLTSSFELAGVEYTTPFQATCLCPSAGSIKMKFSDLINGEALINFNSCGKGVVKILGIQEPFELAGCQM